VAVAEGTGDEGSTLVAAEVARVHLGAEALQGCEAHFHAGKKKGAVVARASAQTTHLHEDE